MSNFELFQESPGLFFIILLISLVLTLFVYGAFPVIFAKTRKKPITKKKYRILCYGINSIGILFFIVFNEAASAGPYLLWTWIFSKYGIKTLESKGLLVDVVSKQEASDQTEHESVPPSSSITTIETKTEAHLSEPDAPNSQPTNSCDATLNTCDIPNDEVAPQATTVKKPNICIRIKKGFLSLSKLKKTVLLLTIASFALLIIFDMCYSVVDDKFSDPAYDHYESTYTEVRPSKTSRTVTVGCGNQSCRYCEGVRKTISYSGFEAFAGGCYYPDHFSYIREIRDVLRFLEHCCNVALILSISGTALLVLLLTIPKIKPALKNRKAKIPSSKPLPTRHSKKQFCKYCGVRIDEDSRFCHSCGKKLI